jgi:hypothetical protein
MSEPRRAKVPARKSNPKKFRPDPSVLKTDPLALETGAAWKAALRAESGHAMPESSANLAFSPAFEIVPAAPGLDHEPSQVLWFVD